MSKIDEAIEIIDVLLEDPTVPKNIKKALEEAKSRLLGNDELSVKVSAAVYALEAVSDDVNMPAHARTQIWAILSTLEGMKE